MSKFKHFVFFVSLPLFLVLLTPGCVRKPEEVEIKPVEQSTPLPEESETSGPVEK